MESSPLSDSDDNSGPRETSSKHRVMQNSSLNCTSKQISTEILKSLVKNKVKDVILVSFHRKINVRFVLLLPMQVKLIKSIYSKNLTHIYEKRNRPNRDKKTNRANLQTELFCCMWPIGRTALPIRKCIFFLLRI